MADFENLKVDHSDRIATITLSRPKVLNALNATTLRELDEAIAGARDDESVGAVLMTGDGEKAFVSGEPVKAVAGGHESAGRHVENRRRVVHIGRLDRAAKRHLGDVDQRVLLVLEAVE